MLPLAMTMGALAVMVWPQPGPDLFDAAQLGRPAALAAGKLLVASRGLADPNFAETVVLVLDHGPKGAAGLIVNVPAAATLASLFSYLATPQHSAASAYAGGPVARNAALALVRSETPPGDARAIMTDVHLVMSRGGIEKRLADGADAREFRVYLGHAGWTAGQLERELALNAWHVFDATSDIVFDQTPQTLWQRQIRRSTWLLTLSR